MPVISTRRYSTATGSSSFLPPSVGGTTSSLSTGYGSSYRSSSLSNSTYTTSSSGYTSSSGLYLPRTSSYRTGLYNSSSSLGGTSTSYRHSTYLSGGNNDTTATSRLGVSNNRYSRSSSDRDTKRITGKTQYNNNINTITSNRTTKTLQTKPPIAGSLSSSRRLSESRIANDQVSSKSDQNYNYNNKSNCNNALSNNINNCNSNQYQSKFTSTAGQEQSDNNNTTKISSSLSSSSLARQVATSGLEFYEKYSPAHYIPKCELSRSRSLSEATPSKLHNNDNNLSNSSNNVHQLLPQKEVLSNDRDNKSPSATSGTATSTTTTTATTTASRSSPSSNKDISTTQLASKVRNASIRSALPPSPTPSRYWDREGRSSSTGVGSRNTHDSDDYTSSSKSSSDSYDKGSTEGLCGLRNIGNTCFMNSVIQCLSHTRELTKFLKTQMGSKASSKDQLILYEFAKLIREMWSPNIRSVTPLELKSAFSTKHRMYSGYNQQDAQEFLRFFLDSLHSALNTGSKGDPLKIDDSLSDNKKADLTWEWYSRVENSVIRDLFVGQLKSALRCTTCGNESVTFDPFWDLSVPLPSSSRCKLDACLELFIREEVLDGDEMPTCSKCQTRRKCTKTFTIQRFPRYLVIHLKRFSETRWSKLSNIVEFPTGERELNMSPYAANSSTNVLYSLYAISNHMGSTAGGHYVALCKHPSTKKWHEFNDNVVSDGLSESALVSSSAYLLFYERAD